MIYFALLAFAFGACIGSFLNVCIYRVPKGQSVAKPKRSFCPYCHTSIPWWDNIPLLSIVLLAAKCRRCKAEISWRYFFVELLAALLSLALFLRYFGKEQNIFLYIIYFFLTALLIISIFVDLEYQIIPDETNYLGLIVGLGLSAFYPAMHDSSLLIYPSLQINSDVWWHFVIRFLHEAHMNSFLHSLLGVLIGGGILYAIGFLGSLALGQDAMGGGDVKLLGMIGAFLGWKWILLVLFLSPLLGLPYAIYIKLKTGESQSAFGPAICLAAILVILKGEAVLKLFFSGFY